MKNKIIRFLIFLEPSTFLYVAIKYIFCIVWLLQNWKHDIRGLCFVFAFSFSGILIRTMEFQAFPANISTHIWPTSSNNAFLCQNKWATQSMLRHLRHFWENEKTAVPKLYSVQVNWSQELWNFKLDVYIHFWYCILADIMVTNVLTNLILVWQKK